MPCYALCERTIRCLTLITFLGFSTSVFAGVEDGPRHSAHLEWLSPSFVDLETDLETVRDEGKTGVMVLFTTQGCTYCAEFIRASLGDPVLVKRVRDNFVAMELEIFDDADMTDPTGEDLPIKQFAEKHKAGMAPTLLFFGPDNRLIFRAIGYQSPQRFAHILDYLVDGHYQTVSYRDFLAQQDQIEPADYQRYPELRHDPLFEQPPFALARIHSPASNPMLVLFETPRCVACADFHDKVLSEPEIRELLRSFEVVRLDAADSTTPVLKPDGKRSTPAQWYADEAFTRMPALLYISESGQTVLKNDALIERQRMLNATNLVLERAYEKGWHYQRFARTKAIERNRLAQEQAAKRETP